MTDSRDEDQRYGINLGAVGCPQCGERMPTIRVPDSIMRLLWGGWKCPNCGCEMDRFGRAVKTPDQG